MGLRATIHALPDGMVRITIPAPAQLKWSPGQHVFIRFLGLGIHAFSSHPFTIASAPSKEDNKIVFILRVYDGVTKAIAARVAGKVSLSVPVWVDGPYGASHQSLRNFDEVFLIAGGSGEHGHFYISLAIHQALGATFVAPILLSLAQGFKEGMICKKINLILAVRHTGEYRS
jgi:hypothetical protein